MTDIDPPPTCPHTWPTGPNDHDIPHNDNTHHCIRTHGHTLGIHICDCGTIDGPT